MAARTDPGSTDAKGEPAGGRATAPASPVAVVWCRQVDNEAESPGYTTVPEEFPGHRETLDAIRIVGNLTVNVADTHDYWDPDPSQPLSYYPNIFLYPAFHGRYTCLGRMFLSTEDRPRLGMKTLVLDTSQLLESGEFGSTILRWHQSMGGPRRDGARAPPPPDPNLVAVVGEGFFFHRGSTEPVVLVAADQWEPALQTILDLIRVLPAPLVSLGAILAFPYFLPQPKTNLHEFTEQLPLSLALMRVPRGEAAGDRHQKRIQSWESAPVTVRDITDGVPLPSGKAKELIPLVLQYVRDHQETKLGPIRQRVELAETTRLRAHLADPERQGGKDRRKEIWRIGTAMESAALLLQKSRGRHVQVNAETAKRAQEYIQAKLPAATPSPEPAAPADVPAGPAHVPGQLPPWLQRSSDPTPASVASAGGEVVPVSVSEDPSLLSPAARTSNGSVPPSVGSEAAAPGVSPAHIEKLVAERIDAARPASDARTNQLVDQTFTTRLAPITEAISQSQDRLRKEVDDRIAQITAAVSSGPAAAQADALQASRAALERKIVELTDAQTKMIDALRTEFEQKLLALQGQTRAAVAAGQAEAADGFRSGLAETLAAQSDSQAKAVQAWKADVDQKLSALQTQTKAALAAGQAETAQAVRAALERRVSESAEAQSRAIQAAQTELGSRIEGIDPKIRAAIQQALPAEVDRRLATQLDPKFSDLAQRLSEATRSNSEAVRKAVQDDVARSLVDLKERVVQAEDDLRTGLSAQLDLHLREAADRELAVQEQLEGRLKDQVQARLDESDARRQKDVRETEQRLTLLVEGRQKEFNDRALRPLQDVPQKSQQLVEERVAQSEGRLLAKNEARLSELQNGQAHAIADLQVRMQSHFDEKLQEAQDREREKYVELLARLKGDVDAALARINDPTRAEQALRDRINRGLEALRAETQKLVDQRVLVAENRLKVERSEGLQRLEQIEAALADRSGELTHLEETLRAQIADLDQRTAVLSDRLVPVVRKAWLKIADIEKVGAPSVELDVQLGQVRREFTREVRRVEGELAERTTEIRDRMETAIANQGRVWLTLIRQLSQLTNARQALQAEASPSGGPGWEESPTDTGLDLVPERPRARAPATLARDPEMAALDDVEDAAVERRRPRRSSR